MRMCTEDDCTLNAIAVSGQT